MPRYPSGRKSRHSIRFDLAAIGTPKVDGGGNLVFRMYGDPAAIIVYRWKADSDGNVTGLGLALQGYRHGEPLPMSKRSVDLTYTATRFGGSRAWLVCPQCHGRRRVLYGLGLQCRQCCNLAYDSQSESPAARACRQMHKIRRRLNGGQNAYDLPDKPSRMHWATYERLAQLHEAHENNWAASVMGGRIFRGLIAQ